MPIAMRALEKSTGKTSKELMKMMENGQLSAEYIKPMIMAMGELAEANGAYEKALRKLGTVENRLRTTAGISAAKIAEAGFTKGLINLYETLMTVMDENGATLNRIGRVYEKVFNGIANVVKVAAVLIEAFVRTLESLWMVMKWGIDNPLMGLLSTLPLITLAVMNLGKVMSVAFRSPLIILSTMIGLFDEVRAFFDENVDGLFDDENATNEQAKATAAQRRIMFGIAKEGDYALAAGKKLNDPTGLTGFGSMLGSNAYDVTQKFKSGPSDELNWIDKALGFVGGYVKTKYDLSKQDPTSFMYVGAQREKQAANVTFNITSTDPKQAADETWSLFSNFFGDAAEAKR